MYSKVFKNTGKVMGKYKKGTGKLPESTTQKTGIVKLVIVGKYLELHGKYHEST